METAKRSQGLTQRDIARLARVSQATVSRVLTGDDAVDLATAQRVQRIITEFNYKPDIVARSLRSRRSGLLGLVVKRPIGGLKEDPFFASLTAEILEVLSESDYNLCLELTTESSQQGVYDELLRSRRVDGLILVESEARDERLRLLQADRFPFVLIGNPDRSQQVNEPEKIWSVDNDNVAAAEQATRHLVEAGFRRIGFFGGPAAMTVSQDRAEGYRRVMEATGQTPMVYECAFGLESARSTASEVLACPKRPDALVVLDDFLAMGVVLAAQGLGLVLPEDLGLVSFNDSRLCETLAGGLTSVNLNIPQLVRVACSKLLGLIEGRFENDDIRRTLIPTRLTVRGSTQRDARREAS